MDDVDYSNETEKVEDKIQPTIDHDNNNSESSDEEHVFQNRVSKQNNEILSSSMSTYGVFSNGASAGYRGGVYRPGDINTLDKNSMYMLKDAKMVYDNFFCNSDISSSKMKYAEYPYFKNNTTESNSNKYYEHGLTSQLSKLNVLDDFKYSDIKTNTTGRTEDLNFVISQLQESVDRDTNNDSGYSTKVYGSSKGNSPNLFGQIDSECLGASSLV